MVERICNVCNAESSVEARACATCGATFGEPQPLAKTHGSALARYTPALPRRWQQAGKAAALGAVALAVEMGAAWLHQRSQARPAPLARGDQLPERSPRRTRYIARHRVWETYEEGQLSRRVVEQTFWRLVDE